MICHADHVQDEKAFQDTSGSWLKQAAELVAIEEYPETGYGYVEKAQAIGEFSYKVASFREKPDLGQQKTIFPKVTFTGMVFLHGKTRSYLGREERLPANMRFLARP